MYCLETTSVCFASAINERQLLYFTYIHERGTELRCYIFLFISLHVRLHVCSVIHFVPVHFHVCLARLKGRVGILFHIHSSESTGYVIHSPHIYLYTFFLEVHMSGSHETMFCRLLFCIFILT